MRRSKEGELAAACLALAVLVGERDGGAERHRLAVVGQAEGGVDGAANLERGGQLEADAVLADSRFVGTARDKMERAIWGYFDYTIDAPGAAAFLVQCWALASQKPLIRDLLVRRRERTVTVAALIGRDAIEAGELPPDFDIEAMARGFTALLDGLVLQRVEEGDSYRRADMERRVLAFLDLVAPRGPDAGRS
jgi:AcrR family transcriptional regulator